MRLFSWKGTFIWYFFPLLLFSAHRLYVDPWWSVSSHKQSWNHCQFVNHTKSQCWRWWHLFMSCWPNWTYQCENTCSYRYLFIFIMMLQKTGDGNHHIFSCLTSMKIQDQCLTMTPGWCVFLEKTAFFHECFTALYYWLLLFLYTFRWQFARSAHQRGQFYHKFLTKPDDPASFLHSSDDDKTVS